MRRRTAANGDDLRISDGAANLPYEIENWNPGGKSIVWVKVPTFSSATTLTLRWGEEAQGIAPPETGFVFHPITIDGKVIGARPVT